MKHRYLGNSGLKVSELIYGNWLTHASQVAEEQAIATVNAALEGGITTFDTADAYANQAAEVVLGKALKGQRREGIEILTKVYWPVAAKGPNDCGLSRKHIFESINGSLKRLQTDYVDLYQAHRFDYETPLEETMQAFADLVRMGKVLYVGAFAYIIGNFNWLAGIVFRSFAGLGITATGSAITMENFLQPGRLAKTGIDAGASPELVAAALTAQLIAANDGDGYSFPLSAYSSV